MHTLPQSGSGPGWSQFFWKNVRKLIYNFSIGHHQSFFPFDNSFHRMSQQSNQMLPNDMIFAKSLAEHNNKLSHNIGEEASRYVTLLL